MPPSIAAGFTHLWLKEAEGMNSAIKDAGKVAEEVRKAQDMVANQGVLGPQIQLVVR